MHYTAPAKNDPLVTIDLKNISAADAFRYVANLANLTVTYKDDGAYFTPKK